MEGEGLGDIINKIKEVASAKSFKTVANLVRKTIKGARPLKDGEFHFLGANFLGPGTRIDLAEVRNTKPINAPDAVAKQHDLDYFEASKLEDEGERKDAIREADNKMIRALKEMGKLEGIDEVYRKVGLKGIQFKRKVENVSPSFAKQLLPADLLGQKKGGMDDDLLVSFTNKLQIDPKKVRKGKLVKPKPKSNKPEEKKQPKRKQTEKPQEEKKHKKIKRKRGGMDDDEEDEEEKKQRLAEIEKEIEKERERRKQIRKQRLAEMDEETRQRIAKYEKEKKQRIAEMDEERRQRIAEMEKRFQRKQEESMRRLAEATIEKRRIDEKRRRLGSKEYFNQLIKKKKEEEDRRWNNLPEEIRAIYDENRIPIRRAKRVNYNPPHYDRRRKWRGGTIDPNYKKKYITITEEQPEETEEERKQRLEEQKHIERKEESLRQRQREEERKQRLEEQLRHNTPNLNWRDPRRRRGGAMMMMGAGMKDKIISNSRRFNY